MIVAGRDGKGRIYEMRAQLPDHFSHRTLQSGGGCQVPGPEGR